MKLFSILAVLALASINAFAARGNDGPSGAPDLKKPALLAEASISCGFCRPAGTHGVRVYANGEVQKFSVERGSPETTEKVAQLEPRVVQNIRKQVESMPNEELIDKDAGQPYCMDAPMTTFQVFKADGSTVQIAKNFNCHELSLQYDQGRTIRGLLQSLLDLSY